MATTFDKLRNRAIATTRAWVTDNWRRPIGSPDGILENLLSYDETFIDLWHQWCEEEGFGDQEPVPDEPMKELLEDIRMSQLTTCD